MDPDVHDKAMRRYARLEDQFLAAGGYAAESEAATIAAALGLPDRVMAQPLHTLSGGQRRRIELARILFGDNEVLLLDEPTNHLDADSIVWLRDFLKVYKGGFIVISHDAKLVEACVNKVFHLDATRATIDYYNVGVEDVPGAARDGRAAPQAGARQRREEGRGAARAGRQDARLGDEDRRRAEHGAPCRPAARGPGGGAPERQGRQAPLPDALPVRQDPADGFRDCRSPMARWRSSRTWTSRWTAARKVVILGLNGAGKTTLLRLLGGVEEPDTGKVEEGHGLKLGYYAQEHETLDPERTVLENMRSAAPDLELPEVRKVLGSFLFSGDDVEKPAGVAVRRREDAAGAGDAGGLDAPTSCCSTSPPTTWTPPRGRRSSARCRSTRAPW